MIRRLALLALFTLAACDGGGRPPDLAKMGVDTSGKRGGVTYAEFRSDRDEQATETFNGFGCLDQCQGHKAGWSWADDNAIGDPIDCNGNSWSFIEGCVVYAVEHRADDHAPDTERGLY